MQNWGKPRLAERRRSVRHNVNTRLRVRVRQPSSTELRAESLNLSERGVYFFLRAPLENGETVEVLLKMPQEITGQPVTEWRCTGQVVRVEGNYALSGEIGVAVAFCRCEALRGALPGRTWVPSPRPSANPANGRLPDGDPLL